MKKVIVILMMCVALLSAKEVQVVFSYSTPPYVFKDGNGIVIDIVKESLAYKHYKVKPVFVNIGRSYELFKNGYVDATSIIKKNSGLKAYYSDYFMQYHNAIFVLSSSHIKIKKLEDLKNYYFISFQNATKYLGKAFGNVAKEAGDKYSEIADQEQQVYKLLMGRTQVVVMDRHIFKFYKNKLIREGKIAKGTQTTLIEMFQPTKYRTAFRDEKTRDDFNIGLKHIKKDGRYDAIYDYYSSKYFKVNK